MAKKKLNPFNLPIPGWNERPMTSEDFSQVCEREGIRVFRRRFKGNIRGLYYRQHGQPIIHLDSRLRGARRLQVEFHELAHHFLHSGKKELLRATYSEKCSPTQEWSEVEANMAALTALAPDFSGDLFNTFLQKLAPHVSRRHAARRKGRRP